ncbi:MAG: M48 family metalloprotease [Bacteroidetes bacterium]|nr:M48 family metalloprotease [Bacteroidota bacterium]
MKKYIFIVIVSILLITIGSLYAQDLENYTPLASEGDIPIAFRTLSVDKFKDDASHLDKNESKKMKKSKEQFLLSSNYFINRMLLSGKVLFNDPVGRYVNEVADEILKDDPELREELDIFIIKSPIVNAITTNNGTIFVTLGLIAQLENEAQLALVLCHEFVHYKNDHVMDSYLEQQKIKKGKDAYRQRSIEEKILATFSYSKDLEFEADEEGLEMYLKTNYSLDELDGVFDVLQYSYLPFDEVEFEKSYFESEHMKFPEDYFLEELDPIAMDDDYDDSKSTHPNIRRRRKQIDKLIREESNEGKVVFILPKEKFKNAQTISRFEVSRLYMISRQYCEAIYNSFLLLRVHPDNKYLRTTIAKALYSLAKYKNDGSFRRVHKSYSDIEGSSQQLYHFLEKLKSDELNSLALRYAWLLNKDYPNDEFIEGLAEDAFRELITEHQMEPSDYFKKPKEELVEELNIAVEEVDESKLSKYEKIKRKRVTENIEDDEKFINFMFVELFQDESFEDMFEDLLDEYEDSKIEDEKILTNTELRQKRKEENKEYRLERRYGKALGIDKIIIVDPYYVKVDERKEDVIQYIDTETRLLMYSETLRKNANKLNLNLEILETKNFRINDTDKFNDFSLLNDWVIERSRHYDNLDSDRNIILSEKPNVDKLVEKYNTKYFMWTGVVSVQEKKGINDYYLATCAIMGCLTIPIGIAILALPKHRTYTYSVLYDVESGEIMLNERDFIRRKDRLRVVDNHANKLLKQVVNER